MLLARLAMAMMTSTFRIVSEKAEVEWRLLITQNVVRLEMMALMGAKQLGADWVRERLLAGAKSEVDGKHYVDFLRVQPAPGGKPKAVPLLMAERGNKELFDEAPDLTPQERPAPSAMVPHGGTGGRMAPSVGGASAREAALLTMLLEFATKMSEGDPAAPDAALRQALDSHLRLSKQQEQQKQREEQGSHGQQEQLQLPSSGSATTNQLTRERPEGSSNGSLQPPLAPAAPRGAAADRATLDQAERAAKLVAAQMVAVEPAGVAPAASLGKVGNQHV